MGYGGRTGGWKGRGRIERGAIAAMAHPVYICRGCGLWNEPRWDAVKSKPMPPPACLGCHRMDFDFFRSKGEAKYWAKLQQRQRAGLIEELEREVRIPLLTVDHRTGKPVEWATYVADFRYRDLESGDRKVEEFKPSGGMSYDAQLKIRCCEAMGIPVAIVTG